MSTRDKGLTLIELAVAMAVVAMLLASTLTVLTRLARAQAAAPASQAGAEIRQAVGDMLSTDLLHASECSRTATGFQLKTMACLDASTMEFRHLPALVEYRVEQIGAQQWLTRTQHPEISGADFKELVCPGVVSIALEMPADADSKTPGDAAVQTPAGNGIWGQVPSVVSAVVGLEASDTPMQFTIRRN